MARRTELVNHLGNVGLFSGLSKSDLGRIAQAGEQAEYPEGATIVEQGDMGRSAFVILEGTAIVRRGSRKVAELEPGAPFGEMSLLDKGPRTAYVVAGTDLTVLEIPAKEFMRVLDEVPKLAVKLLATLAGRVRDLDRKAYG
ncbi:MAG: cyclic nucleotide-binding domain-containing protein [Actinomycetota bacterium]